MAAAAAAHLPGDHRPVAALVRGQPLHLRHGLGARRRGADRAGRRRRGFRALRRSAAPGARAHRHCHQLCHHRAPPGGPARRPRPHRHRPRGRTRVRRMSWSAHLVVVPVVLPLASGALMLLLDERRRTLKAAISVGSLVALLGAALLLVPLAEAPISRVYALGNWPAPFGIVLVADRLASVMVLLAAVLGLAAMLFSL